MYNYLFVVYKNSINLVLVIVHTCHKSIRIKKLFYSTFTSEQDKMCLIIYYPQKCSKMHKLTET